MVQKVSKEQNSRTSASHAIASVLRGLIVKLPCQNLAVPVICQLDKAKVMKEGEDCMS